MKKNNKNAIDIKEEFIENWLEITKKYGFTNSMSQIFAHLLTLKKGVDNEYIIENLNISRGSVHSNIKKLNEMGLIISYHDQTNRREQYKAIKNSWDIFTCLLKYKQEVLLKNTLELLETGKDISSKKLKKLSKTNKKLVKLNQELSTYFQEIDTVFDVFIDSSPKGIKKIIKNK